MSDGERLAEALKTGTPIVFADGNLPTKDDLSRVPTVDRMIAADDLRAALLAGAQESKTDPRGLEIVGAIVVGALDLEFCELRHQLAFHRCLFTDFVQLSGAHVSGRLAFRGSSLMGVSPGGWSLEGAGLRADNMLILDEGFRTVGPVSLTQARIGDHLSLREARLGAPGQAGWTLFAQGIEVGGGIFASGGFETEGAVSLSAASVRGQLILNGAHLNGMNATGWSLMAQGLRVNAMVDMSRGFQAAGGVSMSGAQLMGQVNLRGATLKGVSESGWALDLQNVEADGAILIGNGFRANGAITLAGAHVRGQIDFAGAHFDGQDSLGRSIVAARLRAERDVFLRPASIVGTVGLAGCEISRLVLPRDVDPPALGEAAGWRLADLTGRPRNDVRCAGRWLGSQTTAQPWQELANLYDRIGHPSHARRIRYLSAVRSGRHGTRRARLASWLSRATTGLGYYPVWRTLACLLVVFSVALGVSSWATDDFTTATTPTIRQSIAADQKAAGVASPPPVPGRVPASAWNDAWDTPQFQPWTYALSTAVPTTSSATSQPWTPRTGWLSAVLAVLRALSWIFTALFLAGITGLLRKQT